MGRQQLQYNAMLAYRPGSVPMPSVTGAEQQQQQKCGPTRVVQVMFSSDDEVEPERVQVGEQLQDRHLPVDQHLPRFDRNSAWEEHSAGDSVS